MAKNRLQRFRARDRIVDISGSALLDDLTGAELVVYLRLVAMARGKRARVTPLNRDLHRDSSTATRALGGLAELGLVCVRVQGAGRRTIEVM